MENAFQILKWTERPFKFGYSNDFIPFFVERLSATSSRIEALTADVDDETLSFKRDGHWSVKEHIGHLSDLEEAGSMISKTGWKF